MNIHTDFTANDKDVQKALYRMEQQITKLTQKNRELEKGSVRGSNAATKGIQDWTTSITRLALGYVGVTRFLGTVRTMMTDIVAKQRESAELHRGSQWAEGQLKQMAKTQQEYSSYLNMAASFEKVSGLKREESMRNVFGILSAVEDPTQRKQEIDFYARVAKSRMMREVGDVAMGAARLQTAMPGRLAGHSEILSMMLGASEYAPATVPELLEASARGAGEAHLAGLLPAEQVAATTLVSKVLGPEMGGTYVAQMMRTFKEKKVSGATLQEKITNVGEESLVAKLDKTKKKELRSQIQQMMTSVEAGEAVDPEILKQYMGRSQGVMARELIRLNPELYSRILGNIQEARRTEAIETRMGFVSGSLGGATVRETSERALEQSLEKYGTWYNINEAIQNEIEAKQRREYGGLFPEARIWTYRAASDLSTMLNSAERQAVGFMERKDPSSLSQDLKQAYTYMRLQELPVGTKTEWIQSHPEITGGWDALGMLRELVEQSKRQTRLQEQATGNVPQRVPATVAVQGE